jgi:RNA-binding protein YlmH
MSRRFEGETSEREHVQRMVDHANKVRRQQESKVTKPLTPEELADALIQIKKKYPNAFPRNDRNL